MAFTDQFVRVPVEMCDREENETSFPGYIKLLPTEIQEYRPTYDDAGNETGRTVVTMKSLDSCVVALSVEEFENLLNQPG